MPRMVPSFFELASGCAFRDRCPYAMPVCAAEVPPMLAVLPAVADQLARHRLSASTGAMAPPGATTRAAPGTDVHAAACWLHALAEEGSSR